MESRPPRWGAPLGSQSPPGPLPAPRLLGVLLLPWCLQLAGGQSVAQDGLPIVVSLANTAVCFSCKITYQYTPKFKNFTVSYFYVDLNGVRSPEERITCQPGPGIENQTYKLDCQVTPKLPDASATGTYYCHVSWHDYVAQSCGIFILVRDTGYRTPPPSAQKGLLFAFTGILTALSLVGTALLLWKKKQIRALGKCPTENCPDPKSAGSAHQPPAESIYTALQRQDTEVYACIESKADGPPFPQSPPSQGRLHGYEDDSEFNLVYENF
ncbi:NFAT activation molecule 1 isoform X1 [Tupaia chinensis]|uniref:NFAT activation molecule 1 isoform X1 n=1 Tax=Tupaia chinensis TaxID=246437 RepID=UPI0003C8CECE|nr:NFAT activation molecule 1 isoform X1 [Tupaia chinensis]